MIATTGKRWEGVEGEDGMRGDGGGKGGGGCEVLGEIRVLWGG